MAIDTDVDIISAVKVALADGSVVCRARDYGCSEMVKRGVTGCMVTFGSRSSCTYVRLYDKGAEQVSKGLVVTEGPWFRLEFEYKGRAAVRVADLVRAGDFEAVRGAMLAHLDVKVRGADSNRSRWVTAAWWSELLGTVVKVPLGLAKRAGSSIS